MHQARRAHIIVFAIPTDTTYETHKKDKGFTLIELLVVIAIISLLSSVVLASLNSARSKAKDAAIRAEVHQVQNLLIMNYNDYGTFTQLASGADVILNASMCDGAYWNHPTGPYNSTYSSTLTSICKNIISNIPSDSWFYVGPSDSDYSITVLFLNNRKTYCVGSSGSSENLPPPYYWTSPYALGCPYNP